MCDRLAANPVGPGVYKGHTFEAHAHPIGGVGRNANNPGSTGVYAGSGTDAVSGVVGGAETAPDHARVLPVVLI